MSSLIGEKDRNVLPRWRDFTSTTRLGELAPLDSSSRLESLEIGRSLETNRQDWEKDPSLWNALDFIAGAIVENRLDVAEKALRQVREDSRLPSSGSKFLDAFQMITSPSQEAAPGGDIEALARRQIRESRRRVAEYPWDAIEWVNLARNFTALGQHDKANRSISVALTLAPENRFVLRCSARFFVQNREPDKAQRVLSKSKRIHDDPWILASEIAVSSLMQRTSLFAKVGLQVMNRDLSPNAVTELGAALGTLETETGNGRRAKKLLRQSLIGANENSVAQIEWLNRTRLGEGIDASHATPPLLHEARAWRSYLEGNWEEARHFSESWLLDQPFSGNAATLHSYILSDIQGEFATAVKTLRAAIRCSPDLLMLQNNLAYSLINMGDLQESEKLLQGMHLEKATGADLILVATAGLLEFRKGNVEEGRRLYLQAIDECQKLGLKDDAGRAAIYLAIEEVRANSESMLEAVKRSLDLTRGNKRADIELKLRQLEIATSALR